MLMAEDIEILKNMLDEVIETKKYELKISKNFLRDEQIYTDVYNSICKYQKIKDGLNNLVVDLNAQNYMYHDMYTGQKYDILSIISMDKRIVTRYLQELFNMVENGTPIADVSDEIERAQTVIHFLEDIESGNIIKKGV